MASTVLSQPPPPSSNAYENINNNNNSRNTAVYHEIDSSSNSLPLMVHVIAPARLPAGYSFEAQFNGDPSRRTFTCQVPDGGVQEGESFLAPLPLDYPGPRLTAPTGAWKDQWYDCLKYGPCHAHLWCAICCPQLLMGQVMQRMRLTWLGEPGRPFSSTRHTFKVVLTVVILYFICTSSLGSPMRMINSLTHQGLFPSYMWFPHVRFWAGFLFGVWYWYALCKTREQVRTQYSIPEEHCLGCEDGCCAFCCSCCAVAQLARHTGDYETYPSVCCTETGHPTGTPLTV